MNIKVLAFSLFFMLLGSCLKTNEKLFYIKSHSDLVNMVKSKNATIINKKEKTILSTNEMRNQFRVYKNFGEIYENNHFKAVIILSEIKDDKYNFLLRTIKKSNHKIIDTFLLSGYDSSSGEFCSGYINKDLKVNRTCKSTNFSMNKQINKTGEINFITN